MGVVSEQAALHALTTPGKGVIASADPVDRITGQADGPVPFGAACFLTATDLISVDGGSHDAEPARRFCGVAVVRPSGFHAVIGGVGVSFDPTTGYAPGDDVGVITRGPVWVEAGSSVRPGDRAYVTLAGAFTATPSPEASDVGEFVGAAESGVLVRLVLAGE